MPSWRSSTWCRLTGAAAVFILQDGRGWPGQSTVFPRLRPNGASTQWRGMTRFRAIDLQSYGQLQSNGTPRRGAASVQRRWAALWWGYTSLSIQWPGAAATTGWRCGLELVQPKKASCSKAWESTLFPCILPATRRRFDSLLQRLGDPAPMRPCDGFRRRLSGGVTTSVLIYMYA